MGEDVQIVANLDPLLKPIRADPRQIKQVMLNLLAHARDAMRRGGKLTIETKNAELDEAAASKRTGRPGNYVSLSIRDTGVGVDEETQQRMFDPFFNTKERGTGRLKRR